MTKSIQEYLDEFEKKFGEVNRLLCILRDKKGSSTKESVKVFIQQAITDNTNEIISKFENMGISLEKKPKGEYGDGMVAGRTHALKEIGELCDELRASLKV